MSVLQVNQFRELLLEAAARFGSQAFLIDDALLKTVSYREVQLFSRGLEKELERLEIPVGAPVATLFHNCGLSALLFLAVIACRRVLVPVNPLMPQSELDYVLNRGGCVAAIFDPAHVTGRDLKERVLIAVSDHAGYFARLCMDGTQDSAKLNSTTLNCAFVGEIVFTSGSTGLPKGVVLSEKSLLADAMALAQVYGFRSDDRFLTMCPLFHNSGQLLTTLACAVVGGATAAVKSDVTRFWQYIEQYRASWTFLVPTHLAFLLSLQLAPSRPDRVRGIVTGGSGIDGTLIQRFESRFGIAVRSAYGLTETASIATCEPLDPTPRSLGSSGRPLPVSQVAIGLESDGPATFSARIVGKRGEIMIAGPHVFDRYIEDEELTNARKKRGWLHTGDLGYFDENGNLFVVDRLDSMLIVGGENVYPAEVERLCALLPCAIQVVLSGVDHPILGKELILVYESQDGQVPPLAIWQQIIAFNVNPHKRPGKYVAIQDLGIREFPKTHVGKIDRRAVAALLAERTRSRSRRTQ